MILLEKYNIISSKGIKKNEQAYIFFVAKFLEMRPLTRQRFINEANINAKLTKIICSEFKWLKLPHDIFNNDL